MSVEDRLAILEQFGRYSYAEDGGDPEAYAGMFTEDAVFEVWLKGADTPFVRLEGRNAIREWAAGRYAERPAGLQVRHNQTGTIFDELTSGAAMTRTMLLATRLDPEATVPRASVSGVYRDEWRRTPDGWRFSKRAITVDV